MCQTKQWVCAVVTLIALIGCGGRNAGTGPGGNELTDRIIAIDGSSTVYPIPEAVAEEFRAVQQDIRVTVGYAGTGGGMKKVIAGSIDICGASRAIKESGATANAKMETRNLRFYYGPVQALSDISMAIPEHRVTALIGPSGCGKSTFLRCLNRMNDMIEQTRVEGDVLLDVDDVYKPSLTSLNFGNGWAWSFRSPIRFPNRFLIMSPTGHA